ncbi:MAG TPA: hypothetical protein VFQ39_17215 [Longimicrobium sp.]|nr:hypothetical protein [Longimicrobium sp.]
MKKTFAAAVAALCLLPACAFAQTREPSLRISHDDVPGHLGPRYSARAADLAITTTDGSATLLVAGEVVALQLSDRTLRQARVEMQRDMDEEGGFLGRLVANSVRNTVSRMLQRSIEYRVDELRSVEYTGGRLVFTTSDGERVFENVQINDTDVTASFSPDDARAFVRTFRAVKAGIR